jgi:hypothetical protein
VDLIATMGRTLGFSFAAGVNLYATVAILGLAARHGWVDPPAQFQAFNNDFVIGAAAVMYFLEFFADKIPYVDTIWDMVHTAIRPIGGALIAVTTLGDASPTTEGLVALMGGAVAASSHLTKTSTRAVANTSPEPFSNWILSLTDVVSEAWCHQRSYVCMIQEIGGRPVKPGDTFSAAYIVGFFDSIEEMEALYDKYSGATGLQVSSSGWKLLK